MSDRIYTVAIIGGGPRGLAALEYLYEELASRCLPVTTKTVLFEPGQFPGCGPVYAPDQSAGNWLNIPERLVNLRARPVLLCESGKIQGFPSYQDWAEREGFSCRETWVDHYPQRSDLGHYLSARFDSLAESLVGCGWLTVIRSEVEHIDFDESRARIISADGQMTKADEMVLTLGHQPVEPDRSMVRWQAYAEQRPELTLLPDPYPSSRIIQHKAIHSHSTVAVRGFGLAMIDVVKSLTEARGGRFILSDEQTRTLVYEPSGDEPLKIVPFSLDGLPLVPKPLNASIDEPFNPDSALKHDFEEVCVRLATASGQSTDPLGDLIEIISAIQVNQFLSLGGSAPAHSLSREQLQFIARQWLVDAEFHHDLIVSTELPAEAAMRTYLRMASGLEPVSFDYCQGQVWRHLQSVLFKCLSHAALEADAVRDIIYLHERMKRYSYGPPVAAMQRLVALSQCGLLSFMVVDDPDIELSPIGWAFDTEQGSACATVMINSVLAPPDLAKVSSPLIRQLCSEHRLRPFAESLGALIASNGLVRNEIRESSAPLAMLGRLAKGSLIGTDSLTECFGEHQRRWAGSLVDRLSKRIYGR